MFIRLKKEEKRNKIGSTFLLNLKLEPLADSEKLFLEKKVLEL
jgi:hypothetical protein